MNHENQEVSCSNPEEEAKKTHKQIFNADFLFILITGLVLNVYALVYTYAIFG